MNIVCGVDLVYLPRFKKSLNNGGENFLRRIYQEKELTNTDPIHLAGIFAAKEAVIKALSLTTDAWHDIQVTFQSNCAPKVKLLTFNSKLLTYDLSITHDGSYIIAQFVAILR